MKVIDGIDWINGTTLWRVEYEYADTEGGGQRLDYFKTANRYTLPGSLEMVECLNSDDMTVIGFERVEWYATDTPDDQPSLAVPEDSHHRRIFDLVSDSTGSAYVIDGEPGDCAKKG